MREIRPSGLAGGEADQPALPTPIPAGCAAHTATLNSAWYNATRGGIMVALPVFDAVLSSDQGADKSGRVAAQLDSFLIKPAKGAQSAC